jgi:hypothetical protein
MNICVPFLEQDPLRGLGIAVWTASCDASGVLCCAGSALAARFQLPLQITS